MSRLTAAVISGAGASALRERFTTAGLCAFRATQLSARTMRAVSWASVGFAVPPSHRSSSRPR